MKLDINFCLNFILPKFETDSLVWIKGKACEHTQGPNLFPDLHETWSEHVFQWYVNQIGKRVTSGHKLGHYDELKKMLVNTLVRI